jgi:hypothetical protein
MYYYGFFQGRMSGSEKLNNLCKITESLIDKTKANIRLNKAYCSIFIVKIWAWIKCPTIRNPKPCYLDDICCIA